MITGLGLMGYMYVAGTLSTMQSVTDWLEAAGKTTENPGTHSNTISRHKKP